MCIHVCVNELVCLFYVCTKKSWKNYNQQKTFSKASGFDSIIFLPA